MTRIVQCVKLGREAEGLERLPYPGELGKRIFEQVSKEAWQAWLKHQTIASLETALDPARFVRIHRSTIVNVERIDRIEPFTKDRHVAILKDGTRLNISRSGHKRLKQALES